MYFGAKFWSGAKLNDLPDSPFDPRLGDLVTGKISQRKYYSDAEWEILLRAPLYAGNAVMAAGRTSLLQLVKEEKALLAAMIQDASGALVGELIIEFRSLSKDDQKRAEIPADLAKVQEFAFAKCREAVALVEHKASPEEARAYKRWILSIARIVAAASGEGSLLRRGKATSQTRVSHHEAAVLAELTTLLNLQNQK
jgi:hypothetical protein